MKRYRQQRRQTGERRATGNKRIVRNYLLRCRPIISDDDMIAYIITRWTRSRPALCVRPARRDRTHNVQRRSVAYRTLLISLFVFLVNVSPVAIVIITRDRSRQFCKQYLPPVLRFARIARSRYRRTRRRLLKRSDMMF